VVAHRSGSADGAVSVDYVMSSNDATPGADFQGATSGTFNWADGDANPRYVEFTIEDDGVAEGEEFFELGLTNVGGATIGSRDSVRVRLLDADGASSAPNAIAGANQTVASGASVSLDGTGSNDPDGDNLTYEWTQLSGPSVTLANAASATATFTAPNVSSDSLLRFELTVNDGFLQSSAETAVTVQKQSGGNKKKGGGAIHWLTLVILLSVIAIHNRQSVVRLPSRP